MAHSIFTGSFASLEIRWMDVIAELQRGDSLLEIGVLVGSNILASYLKRRLAGQGRTVGNVRFHTFPDLLSRLPTAPPSIPEKPPLPRLGPAVLLEEVLAEQVPPVFAPLSVFQGFRDALLETFRDLRDAGIDAGELDRAVRSAGGVPDRQPQLEGFADLYRRFRSRAGLFRDVDDDFRAAIQYASGRKPAFGFKHLLVYGIYDVTGQQSRLLATLRHSLEMTYFIPFVDAAVSDFARSFLEARVKELAVQPVHLRARTPASSLERLAAGTFGLSREPSDRDGLVADGSFVMVSAPGESRAALEIVREIFRAVRDGTISGFHEAAVVLRQPESDMPIFTEMLRLHGVPYFIQGGVRFSERPLARAVIALSNLESNSFSRDSILTAMELVEAALPETAKSSWDVSSWRALTNDPRFIAGVPCWDAAADAILEKARRELDRGEKDTVEAGEEEDEAQSVRSKERRLESARKLREAWSLVRGTAAGWPERLSWQEWARFLERRFEPILAASVDWPFLLKVLDEIAGLQALGQSQKAYDVSVGRLKAALSESAATISCPAGRFQRSGVNLLSASAARGLRFPLVIIPGLDEGRFPAKLRQDPLLLDSERKRMRDLPLKSRRIDEEKLLFDMAARSAEKRLVVMTSRLDESSDRERLPSQYFLRLAAAVRGRGITLRDLTQGSVAGFRSVSLDSPAPAKDEIPVDEGEIRLRMITAEPDSAHKALAALAQLEPLRLSRPLAYDQARWINRLTVFDGLIADPALMRYAAEKIGASAGQVSASRIEEYAKCPYLFFLRRVMSLEAWEEQDKTEGMNPLERGLAVHSILERFLTASGNAVFDTLSVPELQVQLEQQARKELDNVRPAGMPDLLWEVERDVLIGLLKEWLEFENARAQQGLRVARLEQPFGKFESEEHHPPFRIQAGRHTFDFRGRIDRIDVSPDGKRARVIDYKTGTLPETMASESTRTPLMSGEKIQIVIYRGALSVLRDFEGLECIEGEYLHLQPKDGQIAVCPFTDEELEQALQALPEMLEVVGDGMEKGTFFPRTRGVVRPSGHCEFCEYLPVCGKDRMQREERKANDPAVQKFLKILEPLQ